MPPSNIDMERSVLASVLLAPTHEDSLDAIDALQPADFHEPRNAHVWEAIRSLMAAGEPVDVVTVAHKAERVRGVGVYLAEILEHPVATDLEHYTRKLLHASAGRSALRMAQEMAHAISGANGNLPEVIAEFQTRVLSLQPDGGADPEFISMRELTSQSMERYRLAAEQKGLPGIKTGFPTLDSLTGGGFRGSKLIIIAARPRIGKTAMACTMAANMAKTGHTVGFFSVEMDKEELDDRWMAQEAGINSARFAYGHTMAQAEWSELERAAERKSRWPILIDDAPKDIGDLCRGIKRMRKAGAEIVFVDQLSQITNRSFREALDVATQNVKALSALKKELRMPIVLLAQINREAEKTNSKRPTLATLKSTGQIEEDADIILLGHRRHPYTRKDADLHHAEWELAKHRGGPTYTIECYWHDKQTKFSELA